MNPSTNMAKCKFIGDECTFTSNLVFKQLKAKTVVFFDALQLALNGNTPIELLISWAKKHLNESDILVTTRGLMTITSLVSQIYQDFQVHKAWLERDKIEQELQLFEHVYRKYTGPGEDAILLEIAKRRNRLELANLYEADSKPEKCAYHKELIQILEEDTKQRRNRVKANEE